MTLASFAGALILPVVLFIALQAAFSMQTLRGQIEADALGQSREINAAIDGRLLSDESALQVLATSQFLIAHQWTLAEGRVAGVQRIRQGWRNVILTDLGARREIWETRLGKPKSLPLRPWIAAYLKGGARAPDITGIVGDRPDCPCVAIHVPVFERNTPRYVLTLELDPGDFQKMLVAYAPAHSTSAVVDRDGLFIARTVAYPKKLGTPATHFVREAIAKSRTGFYPGVTYEGLRNYTAFNTSAISGWSTHIAVGADLLSGAQLGYITLTGVAALAALGLALGIAVFAYRQLRVRRREEALSAQSAKLAAVGQLASGIAHDFNNLLMVISNSLDRISDKNTDPALHRPIDNALVASERGTALVKQLMSFTRSQPLDIGPVDLKALFEGLRGLLQQSVGGAVALDFDLAEDARWVTSNAGQLEMALVNLAVNARDAMPKGGRLTIRSRPSKGKAGSVDVDVTDTGHGMPKEVIDRAMEPFFTTKPLGQGTGLGLAQVFGVISQSEGQVDISSTPGAGTTIILRLKRAEPLLDRDGLASGEVSHPRLGE